MTNEELVILTTAIVNANGEDYETLKSTEDGRKKLVLYSKLVEAVLEAKSKLDKKSKKMDKTQSKKVLSSDHKLVVAVDAQVKAVVIGIPDLVFKDMFGGKVHNLDLRKAGIDLRLTIFGAKDHKEALRTLEEAAKNTSTKITKKTIH